MSASAPADSVYEQCRASLGGESPMELRRLCRQLGRWQDEGTLGPSAAEYLRAVKDELRSRGEELP